MAKAKKGAAKTNDLYVVAPCGTDPESFTIVLADQNGDKDVFAKQSEAQRLCDLLNAAYTLFKEGIKSQGLDKPPVVGKKKVKPKAE